MTPTYADRQINAPSRTYNDPSSGGGNVSQGFSTAAAIATSLTPLVSLFSRTKQPRQVVRRQPVQRHVLNRNAAGGSANLLWIGGIGLVVLGIVALKK